LNATKKTKTVSKKTAVDQKGAAVKNGNAKQKSKKTVVVSSKGKTVNASSAKQSDKVKPTKAKTATTILKPAAKPKAAKASTLNTKTVSVKKTSVKIQSSKPTIATKTKAFTSKTAPVVSKLTSAKAVRETSPVKPEKKSATAKAATAKAATVRSATEKAATAKAATAKAATEKIVASKAGKETIAVKFGLDPKKAPLKMLPPTNGKAKLTPTVQPAAPSKPQEPIPPPSNTNPAIVAKIRLAQAEKELRKDLAQAAPKTSLTPLNSIPPIEKGKDRLILMVRDPYWIHAHWDIMRHSVDRAKAALAENWHTVKPILRLLKLDDSGTTNNAEVTYKDIEIHGGVRNWYIDVDSPPSRFKMLMGYLCGNGRFYELARSNIVTTPAPGGKEATDDHWADIATDAEQIYSMSGGYGDDTQTADLTEVFEERLKRTMDADVLSQFGSGAEGSLKRHKQFHFDVNAELIVFGSTHPEAHVSVGTEPVKVRTDGSFSIRLPLPDRRQVLPATAKSRDGVDEQTVVIAVERNTKVMEPLSSDTDDL